MALNLPSANTQEGPPDVVRLLLDCHERIRRHAAMAQRLGAAEEASPEEVQEAAARVRRYFTEALPLHVADEEETLIPRLQGREALLDDALQRMAGEHRDHEPLLATLIAACQVLEEAPERHAELREHLAGTADALAETFEAHLAEEENVIIPAIRRLCPTEERAELAGEVRARRQRTWGA